jgi:hypothetical protein
MATNAHLHGAQYARFSTGNFFNFNGTGGVWRKACIDSAGGWNARTLVEDMDLSLRAFLKGWHFVWRYVIRSDGFSDGLPDGLPDGAHNDLSDGR